MVGGSFGRLGPCARDAYGKRTQRQNKPSHYHGR
jgi:hypothetical protein